MRPSVSEPFPGLHFFCELMKTLGSVGFIQEGQAKANGHLLP